MKKLFTGIITIVMSVLVLPAVAYAHVVVTPSQTSVGTRTLFSVSVPNEKEVAVTGITLDIPRGLQEVVPNVNAGWHITTTKDSQGNVTSITWAGTVPVGQRADLVFKARAPAEAGELDWKASQTYADGTVVRWNQKPDTDMGDSKDNAAGPYSVTKVINDEASANTPSTTTSKAALAFICSVAALALSVGGLFLRRK